jgi:hypothetical protein
MDGWMDWDGMGKEPSHNRFWDEDTEIKNNRKKVQDRGWG